MDRHCRADSTWGVCRSCWAGQMGAGIRCSGLCLRLKLAAGSSSARACQRVCGVCVCVLGSVRAVCAVCGAAVTTSSGVCGPGVGSVHEKEPGRTWWTGSSMLQMCAAALSWYSNWSTCRQGNRPLYSQLPTSRHTYAQPPCICPQSAHRGPVKQQHAVTAACPPPPLSVEAAVCSAQPAPSSSWSQQGPRQAVAAAAASVGPATACCLDCCYCCC